MKISLLIFWCVVIFCFALNYTGAIDNENLSATHNAEYNSSSSDINQTNRTLQNLTHPDDNKTELNGTIISNQTKETQKPSTDNISDRGNNTSNDYSIKPHNISNNGNETSLLPKKKEYFGNILLITAFVVILISLFIIWAINRDIEGNVVPEENYFWFWPYKKKDPNKGKEGTTPNSEKQKNEKAKDKERQFEVMKSVDYIAEQVKNSGKSLSFENRANTFFSGLSAMVLFLIGVCVIVTAILFFLFALKILAFEELLYLLVHFFIFYSLILFFTAIFTNCMRGYVNPLVLGLISGSGIFLILLSMTFSIKINFGIISIPTYMPASSFFGVLAYIFISLLSSPSQPLTKDNDEEDDNVKTKKFLVRYFAAIVIGIMVYVALQPVAPGGKENTPYTDYGYMLFGFASGFYINGVNNFLRDKIFNLIGKEFFKKEERKRIIKEIITNPEDYITLQEAKITTICGEINLNEEEIKKRINFAKFIGVTAFKKLSRGGICSFEDLYNTSDDKLNKIEYVDKQELQKIAIYVKIFGKINVMKFFEKGITYKDLLTLSKEKITEICKELKIDEDEVKKELDIFKNITKFRKSVDN